MFKKQGIPFPSNKQDLDKMTNDQLQLVVEANCRTMYKNIETISSLIEMRNLLDLINRVQPESITSDIQSGRRAVTSAEDMSQILKAMIIVCEKPSCMILIDTMWKELKNGKHTLNYSVACDDIGLNKRYTLHIRYYDYDGSYNVLLTVGKVNRDRYK